MLLQSEPPSARRLSSELPRIRPATATHDGDRGSYCSRLTGTRTEKTAPVTSLSLSLCLLLLCRVPSGCRPCRSQFL